MAGRFPYRHLLVRLLVQRPLLVLAAGSAVALLGLYLAAHLRIDADLARLLPADHPTVQALERLREVVGSESEATVAIRSPSFAANRSFAEDLIPLALALRSPAGEPYFQRVDYRRDIDFLRRNALYFATDAELDQVESFLHEAIAESRLRASPLYAPLEEAGPADSAAVRLQRLYAGIVVSEYPISPDSTVMALRFYPSMAQTDVGLIEAAYAALQELVDRLQPQRYHPHMEVLLAGRMLRQLTEVQAITRDVYRSFAAGVSAVLLTVVLYFSYKTSPGRASGAGWLELAWGHLRRAPLMAAIVGLPFLMSLAMTFGVAYLVFGTLNLMTSTLGLILFGLGIDYGIHFYARYAEERALGSDPLTATDRTFASTGQAIAVSAMTTAGALYVLVAGQFRGFTQFGFLAGTGILLALVAMVVFLPALVSVCERRG